MGQADDHKGLWWLLHTCAHAGQSLETNIAGAMWSESLSPKCLDLLPKPRPTTNPEEPDAYWEPGHPAHPGSSYPLPLISRVAIALPKSGFHPTSRRAWGSAG